MAVAHKAHANYVEEAKELNGALYMNDFSKSLQDSIKNIIKKEGYVSYVVETKSLPQAGNFLSLLYEVDINGKTANGKKITSLFIKRILPMEKIRLATPSVAFARESLIYSKLSRLFDDLQDAADVPDTEKFKFLKSYDSDNDVVIMENVSKRGFKTYDRLEVVPVKFAELSIIALAKFHALSYVTKKKHPRYFDEHIATVRNDFNLDSDWSGFVYNLCSVTAEVLSNEAVSKIKNYAPRMLEIYRTMMQDFEPENGCLCHGDYKILNILVKEVDGSASEILPIDYQLIQYGTPVDDFLFFIFTGTDREFRSKHLNYLKNLYFESFTKFLGYFDIDVNATYSRGDFEKDYSERLELGLVFGLYMSVFTFANIKEGFDVTKRSLSELPIIPNDIFEHRVKGIVEDYIEWGYL